MKSPMAILAFIFFGLWLGPLGFIWSAGTAVLALTAMVMTGLHVQNQNAIGSGPSRKSLR